MVAVRLSGEQGVIQLRDGAAEQAANGIELKEIEEIEFTDIKSAV